mgnify:CR=1 FL=1
MKSCWIVTKDHKAVLEWRDIPVPQPKEGEIVLKVHATALNRGELVVGGAVHGGPEKLGGNEGAGDIIAVAGIADITIGVVKNSPTKQSNAPARVTNPQAIPSRITLT